MEVFDFIGTKLSDFLTYTGFANAEMGNWIMILVATLDACHVYAEEVRSSYGWPSRRISSLCF